MKSTFRNSATSDCFKIAKLSEHHFKQTKDPKNKDSSKEQETFYSTIAWVTIDLFPFVAIPSKLPERSQIKRQN